MTNKSPDRGAVENVLSEAQWLRGFALYLTRDADEADDVVQETWMAAMRAAPEPRASMRPWLAQVLRNARRKLLRESGRRQRREVGASLLQAGEEVASTEAMLARLELSRMVSELLRDLDEPYRSTLLLRFFEGREPTEIARAQGIPPGTVRWRVNEGLRRLRAGLDQAHGGDREKWRAVLLAPLEAPAAGGAAHAGAGVLAWVAGGALVAALIAGWLVVRPQRAGEGAALTPRPAATSQPSPGEGGGATRDQNRAADLFGVVLPAFVATADVAPTCLPGEDCVEVIPRSQLPAPVEAAFARFTHRREIEDLRIEQRDRKGHPTYKFRFEVDDQDEELELRTDGTFMTSQVQLDPADLPPTIAQAVAAAIPESVIKTADLHNEAAFSYYKEQDGETGVRNGPLMHDPGRRFYRLQVRTPDGIRQVEIDEAGKLLRNFPL